MMAQSNQQLKLNPIFSNPAGNYTVVRALQPHIAKSSNEFTFDCDDCFYMPNQSSISDFIQVIHPKTKKVGLVPSFKIEFVKSSTPTKSPHRQSTRASINILAYVMINCPKFEADDLECSQGEPILILEDLDEHHYLAKPIGKLGSPGKILKSNIELKESLPTPKTLRPSTHNSPEAQLIRSLKKNNSTGSTQRPEKPKSIMSRRTESTPNAQLNVDQEVEDLSMELSNWGILGSNLKPSQLDTNIQSTEPSVIPNAIPLASITSEFTTQYKEITYFQLDAKLSTGNITRRFRTASELQQLQLNLLEAFPVEAGMTGKDRMIPYMPQLEGSEENLQILQDLNVYFEDLLSASPMMTRSKALISFVSLQPIDSVLNGTPSQASTPPLTISPASTSSQSTPIQLKVESPIQLPSSVQQVKIKLKVNNDLMAFWVHGPELTISTIKAKVNERAKRECNLVWVNPNTEASSALRNQHDLAKAIQLSPTKLFLKAL